MIVMKFGGTSNQDAGAMKNVIDVIVRHRERNPVIVISAIAQATNVLERAATLAARGRPAESRDALLALFDRHRAILDELVHDRARHAALSALLARSLSELEELVKGVAILREITPRTLDAFYAYGELSSSQLVAAALQETGVDSQWIDTKEFMMTDDNHTAASPVMDIVELRLRDLVLPLVGNGIVPVTQGFIGVTAAGNRSTMGRESSDYSASIVGAALRADEIQIWTDVDGVLTADPRVVPGAKPIAVLTFEEAFELSYFGAKVLHPNTMLPAMEKEIPIKILNSRTPGSCGTIVMHAVQGGERPRVTSIASKSNITLLKIAPKKRFTQFIFWEHIYNVLTRYGVRVYLTGTSEYGLTLIIDENDAGDGLVSDLGEVGVLAVERAKGIVAVVGRNIERSPDILARLFGSSRAFPVSFVSYGASHSSVSLVVDSVAVENLVRTIHDEFFGVHRDNDAFEETDRIEADRSSH